jgi:hypothetical protein
MGDVSIKFRADGRCSFIHLPKTAIESNSEFFDLISQGFPELSESPKGRFLKSAKIAIEFLPQITRVVVRRLANALTFQPHDLRHFLRREAGSPDTKKRQDSKDRGKPGKYRVQVDRPIGHESPPKLRWIRSELMFRTKGRQAAGTHPNHPRSAYRYAQGEGA